jgi:hypothetical protein
VDHIGQGAGADLRLKQKNHVSIHPLQIIKLTSSD